MSSLMHYLHEDLIDRAIFRTNKALEMEQLSVDTARHAARDAYLGASAKEDVELADPVVSFQTDTWRRHQGMREEINEDTEWSLGPVEQVDSPIDEVIESGLEYEWDSDEEEAEVLRPISRYGTFVFELKTPGGEIRHIAFARAPIRVQEGLVSLNVVLGAEEDISAWTRLGALYKHETTELETGAYRAEMTRDGLQLEEIDDDLSEVPTIHPKRDVIMDEVRTFFDNSELYTRFGQDGTKKWMMIGPPGTGKTTMQQQIAREMKEDRPCVFAGDISAMLQVQRMAADAGLSVVIFLEDAEQAFKTSPMGGDSGQKGGADSKVLNALDGVDTPTNENGCAIIMSTNHPSEIEDRILERPGRVDRPVEIGFLEEEYALRCAQLYLPDEADVSTDTILDNVDGASGDEIRAVCEAATSLSVAEQIPLDDEAFEEAVETMEKQLNAAEEFAEQESSLSDQSAASPGF